MNRRQYDRTKIEPLEMVIEEIEGSRGKYEEVSIRIEEVGLKGVRFTTNVEFSIDEMIHFHLPSISVASLISGRIAWKKEVGAEQFQYGLQVLNG